MEKKFFKEICLANATMALAKVVLSGVDTGNVHSREIYSCLCKIAGDEDTTNDEIWNDKESSFLEANGYWLQGYEDFKYVLFNLKDDATGLEGEEELFLETLWLAVEVWKGLDFLDEEFVDFCLGIRKSIGTEWSAENLANLNEVCNVIKQEIPTKL